MVLYHLPRRSEHQNVCKRSYDANIRILFYKTKSVSLYQFCSISRNKSIKEFTSFTTKRNGRLLLLSDNEKQS